MAFTGGLDFVPLVDDAAAFAGLGAGEALELAFALLVPPPWPAEGAETMVEGSKTPGKGNTEFRSSL